MGNSQIKNAKITQDNHLFLARDVLYFKSMFEEIVFLDCK